MLIWIYLLILFGFIFHFCFPVTSQTHARACGKKEVCLSNVKILTYTLPGRCRSMSKQDCDLYMSHQSDSLKGHVYTRQRVTFNWDTDRLEWPLTPHAHTFCNHTHTHIYCPACTRHFQSCLSLYLPTLWWWEEVSLSLFLTTFSISNSSSLVRLCDVTVSCVCGKRGIVAVPTSKLVCTLLRRMKNNFHPKTRKFHPSEPERYDIRVHLRSQSLNPAVTLLC